ncbi:putative alkaloid synthase/Surface mucin Hemomucin [Handroanthus impetiginosus]|uniref:Putative alkaloid synthase/Surface mucin Hemomucin n=1 Tax=Handroanthus impetiginosus TaxID=429701 RepID=A0A2G9GX87_9LAMI|nr:putative alkaloid synthase/Surface mucin Hemomucin [Handroanthus impetiginosus]
MAKLPIPFPILISIIPVIAAVIFFQLESFDPVPYPEHELTRKEPLFVPKLNSQLLRGSEKIGEGQLTAPEDIAYDPKTGEIYTGCLDGWVSRVRLNGSASEAVVEKWVNTGGRPLGIAHGVNGEVIVADANKGLLNISRDGVIELLTDEAEGLKFKLTDAVDVGPDGILYFTDASYKHTFEMNVLDLVEGRPNGRFLSYDPSTKETQVLVKDLYFANGVAVSPDQTFVIFCETAMRRCKRYYIQGPRKGSVDIFVENLPGLADNIRYDGEGQYWIGLTTEQHMFELYKRYPSIRKIIGMMEKYTGRPHTEKNGGVIAVDLDGKPTAHYHDPDISLVSSGVKIGDHLYCGSLVRSYIVRLNLSQYPATPAK